MSYQCPDCKKKISEKNYDDDFEMYECPGCGGLFQLSELVENGAKTAAGNGPGARSESQKAIPRAKGKLKKEALARDEEADAKQIEEITGNIKPKKKEERHRDEVQTGLVLNIIADEIESICEELGVQINRVNAREFYAMNLYRPLIMSGVHAREQDVEYVTCKEHS